jgi:gliding motility-associated-like protein
MLPSCKAFTFLFACCLVFSAAFCQEGNNWYFGNRAGISFANGLPTALSNGALNTIEGVSSISDDTGQLLFYTDGSKVWNRQHQVMPNGTGLKGHASTANSAIIVAKPGSNTIYYIFTADAIENNNAAGYNFSAVDMSLDGGLGDINGFKNVLLYAPGTEKLTAARAANGIDVWVITKDWGNNTWKVFKVDCNGVNTNPVISGAGSIHNEQFGGLHVGSSGCAKISPDGALLAGTRPNAQTWDLCHFDNTTGLVSGGLTFSALSVYGVEFSPNSKWVYINDISGTSNIRQYDISVYDAGMIRASATEVGGADLKSGALQLGPDGKIYCSKSFSRALGVINAPDARGAASNYSDMQIDLQQRISIYGLPAIIADLVVHRRTDFSFAPDSTNCRTVKFAASSRLTSPLSWQWDFGDGTTGAGQQIAHTYTLPDTVLVRLTVTATTICGGTITTTRKVPIPRLTPSAGFHYTPACINAPATFSDASSLAGITEWHWDFGDGTTSLLPNPVHSFTSTGNYQVHYRVTSTSGCSADTTKTISILPVVVSAGNDTITAIGQPLQLQAAGAAAYQWSPATGLDSPLSAAPIARLSNDMVYYLSGITAQGCTGYDTLHIKVYKGTAVYVPNAFTPNGDAANDVLKPIVPGIKNMDYFLVYNRAGQLVFKTTSAGNGWDGRLNGQPQPPGAYVWVIQLQDYLGVTHRQKGIVVLLR